MAEEHSTAAWGHIPRKECPHLPLLREGTASEQSKCRECEWTEDLRLCLSCGYVGCCESHNAHDTHHFRGTGHPLIRPHRCDYDWLWCYGCNAFLE